MRLIAPRVKPGDMVLLSPCASLDQFKNFEQRGDVFNPPGEGVRLMRLSLPRLKMPRLPGFGILALVFCGAQRLGDGLSSKR